MTVRTSRVDGFVMPSSDGSDEEWATFKVLTVGDNWMLEDACSYEVQVPGGKMRREVDPHEMRRMTIKRCLVGWTLDVPIEREHGWMTQACYARVGKVFGSLVDAFADQFDKEMAVTEDDDAIMTRQSLVLFAKNSKGVVGAHEGVRLYCNYGSFEDKFGLSGDELRKMPVRDFTMLRMMLSREGAAQQRQAAPKASNTRIATGKGIRRSRGVVVGR